MQDRVKSLSMKHKRYTKGDDNVMQETAKEKGQGQETEEEKTPEQIETERLDRYMKNPDSFVELRSLICAAIVDARSDLGVGILVAQAPRAILDIAQAELIHAINNTRNGMDQAKKKIIKPNGILDFARRKK